MQEVKNRVFLTCDYPGCDAKKDFEEDPTDHRTTGWAIVRTTMQDITFDGGRQSTNVVGSPRHLCPGCRYQMLDLFNQMGKSNE